MIQCDYLLQDWSTWLTILDRTVLLCVYFRPDESLPVCQKVLVRKGDNGQLVVVRRTILGKRLDPTESDSLGKETTQLDIQNSAQGSRKTNKAERVRKITNDGEMRPTERESFVEVCSPNKTIRSAEQSGEANQSSKSVETKSSFNCDDKECEANLTTSDLLRDILHTSRTPRYDQMSLRGVRRMAYQSMAQQNNAYADEAREFIRKFSDHQNSKLKPDVNYNF
uniref:Uncharacterized protein n=1 Tax=Angiostrongylus cantonensis TaxID=6313 RepID=A0A0K0DDU9_ANGCA